MQVEFVLERVHTRKFLSIRAYRIIFADTGIYIIHLGEDSSQLPIGAGGGLAGALAQSIANKQSEKAVARAEDRMSKEGLDAMVAGDKRSQMLSWSQLEAFESACYKWNRWPHITFKIRGGKTLKFTFDLQMKDHQDLREGVVDFMRSKTPALVREIP